MRLPSYPKVYNLGNAVLGELLTPGDRVVVQEKVDGSQVSFGLTEDRNTRWLTIRSKGALVAELVFDNAADRWEVWQQGPSFGPFELAIASIQERVDQLETDYIFRGEFLAKPKHNTLAYNRTPQGNIILFDIQRADGSWMNTHEASRYAADLDYEYVPSSEWAAEDLTKEKLMQLLDQGSVLEGQLVEGVVIKNYGRFNPRDGHPLFGKHVSEAFKEVHQGDWKERNPNKLDLVDQLVEKYRTPARWDKAIQHLADRGELTNSPKDIGPLMKEAGQDLKVEEELAIKELLFKALWPKIQRGATRGLPEYYKEKLLERQFDA